MTQPPQTAADAAVAPDDVTIHPYTHRPVAFPFHHAAYITLSVLDLVFTKIILNRGGMELNTVAQWMLDRAGPRGLVVVKFAAVFLVVMITERLAHDAHATHGPARRRTARRLAEWAIAISAIPVIVAVWQLVAHEIRA